MLTAGIVMLLATSDWHSSILEQNRSIPVKGRAKTCFVDIQYIKQEHPKGPGSLTSGKGQKSH